MQFCYGQLILPSTLFLFCCSTLIYFGKGPLTEAASPALPYVWILLSGLLFSPSFPLHVHIYITKYIFISINMDIRKPSCLFGGNLNYGEIMA